MSVGEAGPGSGNGPGRRVVEVATAAIVAVVVASGVVAVGLATRDDPQRTASPGSSDSSSEEPGAEFESTPLGNSAEPEDASTQEDPTTSPAVEAEVTNVELGVDQEAYTGRCPVTLTFDARITTNTGPLRADVEWRDAGANEVEGERVQFGGPGPDEDPVAQGVTVTHEVDVTDDATVERTLVVIDPNEIESNTVTATVTCTPYAEITKGGDEFDDAPLAADCHLLHFDATITVPRNMTVTYEWLRLDGTTAPTGVQTAEFTGGGTQKQSIPRQSLTIGDVEGEFGYRVHIIEPHDVLSDPVTYDVNGCSEPAT